MASIDIFNRKTSVPEWVARWWEFDRNFSAKVMAGDWRNMKEKDLIYAGIQTTLAVALVGCSVLGRDLKTQETPTLVYSPSGEIVPINMFGQDTIFYTAQPAFVELGLSAKQVEVIQLKGSSQYTALQLMEVQDGKGEIFYNLMFQGKNNQVKQEWAVLLADSPQSPESVLYQLDLVSTNGHNEFVANMARPMGNLTSTQLQINLPGETGVVPVPTADLIGLFSGAQSVLANVESTSTPVATLAPTPRPTATLTPFPTPTEIPTLVAVDHMPAGLDKAHQDLWSNALDLSSQGLHREFGKDSFDGQLFYLDSHNNVVATYWQEKGVVVPALKVGKYLFVNENTKQYSIVFNPKGGDDDAARLINVMRYFEGALCAKAKDVEIPGSGIKYVEQFMASPDFDKLLEGGCNITFKPSAQYFGDGYDFNVGYENWDVSSDRGFIVVLTGDKKSNTISINGLNEDGTLYAEGVSVDKLGNNNVIRIFSKGQISSRTVNSLAPRLSAALKMLVVRLTKLNVRLNDGFGYGNYIDQQLLKGANTLNYDPPIISDNSSLDLTSK